MKTSKIRNLTVCFAASFLMASLAQMPTAAAHTHHTANVCSTALPAVCAHLGFEVEPNSADEWTFMLHFQSPDLDSALLTSVEVKLWMDMGHHSHGSSPVTVTPKHAVHFLVEEAYFPMRGPWQIKVNFIYEGEKGELIIPVDVK